MGTTMDTSQTQTQNKQGKTLTQQIFHPGLFNRPRSQSLSDCNHHNTDLQTETRVQDPPDTANWTEVSSRKRQRSGPELAKCLKQSTLSTYWLSQPVDISNSFSVLENEESNPPPQSVPITPKPPPIFVDKVTNIRPLTNLLNNTVPELYEIKVLPKDQVRIQSKTVDSYRTIIKELDSKGTEYYSYKPKQERSFKTILKNLHPSTDVEEIRDALAKLGHISCNIWNMKEASSKKPLRMFIVELESNSNNKEVYNIKRLLNCRVSFEPPRPKRTIPQCSNCQSYGHTKSYCRRKPRCIKCAGNHASSACLRKERSENVKCVLCESNHPANYKGCIVFKELQRQKFSPLQQKPPKPNQDVPTTAFPEIDKVRDISYVNVVRNATKRNQNPTKGKKTKETTQLPPPQATTISSQLQQDEKQAQNSNELKDLIDMFKQMMHQMTAMTSLLVTVITELRSSAQYKTNQDFQQPGGKQPTLPACQMPSNP